MKENEPLIIVIGGMNCDISGTPADTLLMGDSNPGTITLTPGGVGRNIAEDLTRLGRRVSMITALGQDANGAFLRRSCGELGIDLSLSLILPDERTSTYLCLNDEKGEVVAAIADMGICERLTPAVMEERLPELRKAALLVLDANLPEDTVRFIAEHTDCPMAADPVSVKKARRIAPALSRFALIKPNRPEAELLSGVPIYGEEELPLAAEAFRKKGLGRTVISLGGRGVYWHDGTQGGIEPCLPMPVVNTNGCGDAFLAAAASAYLDGKPLKEMVRFGLAASAVTAGSDHAVSPVISTPLLLDCIQRYS